MKTTALLALASMFAFFGTSAIDEDRKAVEGAVADYLEALYDAKPELIERSVHKDLRKVGFWRRDGEKDYGDPLPMTYGELHALAGSWNASGTKVNEDSPREIEVLDVLDHTASAKLTAYWGIDYFHLAKYDGKWKIINVLWQAHPPAPESGAAR